MRDDPRKNLKWLEQELQAAERPPQYRRASVELPAGADALLEEDPEPPVFAQKRRKPTRGERIQQAHMPKLDESAAVLTKTKTQLRREAKQQKAAEKKSSVNRNLKDLVFLAVLEIIGILCILGWWLQ